MLPYTFPTMTLKLGLTNQLPSPLSKGLLRLIGIHRLGRFAPQILGGRSVYFGNSVRFQRIGDLGIFLVICYHPFTYCNISKRVRITSCERRTSFRIQFTIYIINAYFRILFTTPCTPLATNPRGRSVDDDHLIPQ